MKPYYEQSGVTIYHGDYRDVLPIADCAIVTDQPYGTGWTRAGGRRKGQWDVKAPSERPAWDVFSLDWIALASPIFWAAFCPNTHEHEMARVSTARVNWRKTNPRPQGLSIDAIFLWPVFLPAGIEWTGYNGDTPHHPCEKPEALMRWLLQFCDPRWTLFDPFMGSGTTLVAAKRLGRRCVGIDIDERYCEVAAKRLSQEALPLEVA